MDCPVPFPVDKQGNADEYNREDKGSDSRSGGEIDIKIGRVLREFLPFGEAAEVSEDCCDSVYHSVESDERKDTRARIEQHAVDRMQLLSADKQKIEEKSTPDAEKSAKETGDAVAETLIFFALHFDFYFALQARLTAETSAETEALMMSS